jgi:hypothetical protein
MTPETLVASELETEIEQLKDEISELYPRSQAMRLEIGAKLLELQAKLAHYGNGTFIETVVSELHIPKSTCYELMEFARVKGEPESLSGFETNFEEESVEDTGAGKALPPQEKVYPRKTQIQIVASPETREKLKKAVAKVNAAGREAVLDLSKRITREVFRAAAKIRA